MNGERHNDRDTDHYFVNVHAMRKEPLRGLSIPPVETGRHQRNASDWTFRSHMLNISEHHLLYHWSLRKKVIFFFRKEAREPSNLQCILSPECHQWLNGSHEGTHDE